MLEELGGITSRKVVEKEESTLEKLIKIGREAIKNTPRIDYYDFGGFRDPFYKEIKKKLNFEYTAEDIVSLMRAESIFLESEKDKKSFGLYTGALLSLLTDKNRAQGKETLIHIKDIELDYMLLGVKNADTIIIESCKGDNILKHAGSHEGKIKNITLNNNQGDRIGSWIARFEGNAGTIILNNKGYEIGSWIADDKGNAGTIMSCNNSGHNTLLGAEAGEIIRKEKNSELYKQKINELRLNKVMELLNKPELDTERLLEALENA